MRIKVSLIVAALALISLPMFAQQGNSEVSANFTGSFQNQVSGLGVTDTPSYSGGLLVNYRYHFNRWSAIEANYQHAQFSQFYSSGTTTQASLNEASLAYQFTFGVAREARFHPFLEAGTGAVFFGSPIAPGSTSGGLAQNRPAFLYGGGVTYRVKGPLAVQVGYRGLFYKAADFTVGNQVTNATAHLAEPYAGLTFRF
jgi:opacity protein-like surface antigen